MAEEESPAFQWYPKDYLTSTPVMMMTLSQEGAYRRLLDYQWLNGWIPESVEEIAKLCRVSAREMAKLWPGVAPCFQARPDGGPGLVNFRLEREREKQRSYRKAKREAGQEGAESKWGARESSHDTRSKRLSAARKIATHTEEEWREMFDFFGGHCVRCDNGERKIVKDHIRPLYQGGSDGITNIQPLCFICNGSKGPESLDFRRTRSAKIGKVPLSKWFEAPVEMPGKCLADEETSAGVIEGERLALQFASSFAVCSKETPLPPAAPPALPADAGESSGRQKRSKKPKGTETEYDQDFLEFYQSYPKHEGKAEAQEAFRTLKRAGALPSLQTLSAAARAYAARKPDPRYQKFPSGWLRERRWEDEESGSNGKIAHQPTYDELEWQRRGGPGHQLADGRVMLEKPGTYGTPEQRRAEMLAAGRSREAIAAEEASRRAASGPQSPAPQLPLEVAH